MNSHADKSDSLNKPPEPRRTSSPTPPAIARSTAARRRCGAPSRLLVELQIRECRHDDQLERALDRKRSQTTMTLASKLIAPPSA